MTVAPPEVTTPVLRVERMSKTFVAGQPVLVNASLVVLPGEVHGLLGQNGSGKSTLAKILAGYHSPDPGGGLQIGGQEVKLPIAPGRFRALGLSFVHQDLGLIDELSIQENVRVGRYSRGPLRNVRVGRDRELTAALLSEFGLDYAPEKPVGGLSAAEKAILAIARAVDELEGRRNGVLVLDEPTASLGRDEVARVFAAVRAVTARGLGVVFVSHRIDEVLELTDRVTVLRDGHVAGLRTTRETTEADLIELIVGTRIDEMYPAGPSAATPDPGVRIAGLTYGGVGPVDLEAKAGEMIGLTGLIGSGAGLVPDALSAPAGEASGVITVGERAVDLARDGIVARRRAGLVVVPADRRKAGGAIGLTLSENVTLPRLSEFFRHGFLRFYWEIRDTRSALTEFLVRPPRTHALLGDLSGGNQQKAILAKWVRTGPRVLVLHEPTQGVDIGARREIFLILRALAEKGTTVILVSNEHEDLAHLCDRVLVFADNAIRQELRAPNLTEDAILRACYA